MSTRVRSVRITHFAGIRPENAFALQDFSPGVNILHGPNGCGKTTTARATECKTRSRIERPLGSGRSAGGWGAITMTILCDLAARPEGACD